MQLEELQAARSAVTEISATEFAEEFSGGKNQAERLSQSWRVRGEGAGQQAVNLYALDPKDVVIGGGRCKGWCRVCAMQLVGMRNAANTELRRDVTLSDEPQPVAKWVTEFVIGINDSMGVGKTADERRKELFLPFVDSLTVASNKSMKVAKKGAHQIADWVVRGLLPEVFDDDKFKQVPEMAEQAAALRALGEITSESKARRAKYAARHAEYAAGYTGCAGHVAGCAGYAARYARHAGYAARYAGYAARYSTLVLGWEKVGELLVPALAKLIASSVPKEQAHLAVARSNADVARALEEMGKAA